MTIVMIGHKGVPSRSGGIERCVEELSTALVKRGVRVISFDRKWYVGDEPSPAGVLRRWSYGIKTKHLDAITHTFTAIILARRDRPDIIHIHGVGPSLLAPFARILHPRAKIVSTFHCVDRTHAKWGVVARAMLRMGEAFTCRFADRTITVSETLALYCLNTYECQPCVIPNGVRIEAGSDMSLLSVFGLKPYKYFAMVTRLVPHKNAHLAIQAHKVLATQRPDLAAQYPLVIVGGSAFTGEYAKELEAACRAYPHVRMVGEQYGSMLSALQEFALAHLSIASSEGMSISLLEAMAMCRPVIVSDIPENTGVTGTDAIIVRTGDVDNLAHALETVCDLPEDERFRMGVRLAERVNERHNWDVIADDTLALYREISSSPVSSFFRMKAV
ncbi:MAG: hypothetical protein AMXMBFR16_02420 [Candidatus Uhrbacteria bacterium]|uniref:Glycosyltransferase family 4 protein n=1 Tax=candidate division WWE3 bacterium TaxID=2053526 RepID=A0A928Y524_UNCKA|nr:glycosyltransferase family 4 protein [candidate division WWE3 bacterium]